MYSIGELSRITGCHIESIRQYERKGLIQKPGRTENGHRRYSDQQASVLKLIMQFRRADFSLKDIKAILDSLNQHLAPCGKIEAHSLKYAYAIEEKRKALDDCEKMLEAMTSTCLKCHKAHQDTIIDNCPLVGELVNNFNRK